MPAEGCRTSARARRKCLIGRLFSSLIKPQRKRFNGKFVITSYLLDIRLNFCQFLSSIVKKAKHVKCTALHSNMEVWSCEDVVGQTYMCDKNIGWFLLILHQCISALFPPAY